MRRRHLIRRFARSFAPATLLAAAALVLAPVRAPAMDIQWNNASGGAWNDPLNWSPPQVPTDTDRALLTLAGTYTVNLTALDFLAVGELVVGGPGATPTLALAAGSSLNVQGGLAIASGALVTLAGDASLSALGEATIAGRLEVTSASFGAEGGVHNTGVVQLVATSLSGRTLNDGTLHCEGMCGLGSVENGVAGVFEARTGPGLFPGAFMDTLLNRGHISFGPSIQAIAGTLFDNQPGGVIALEASTTAGGDTIRNAGYMRLAASARLQGTQFAQLASGTFEPSYDSGSVLYAVLCQDVSLGGTLAPVFAPAFSPPPGNLPLLFSETITGQFAIVSPAGTHGIAVDAAYLDHVYLRVLGPGLVISPPGGANDGPVSATISGSDLASVTAVRLTRSGQSPIFAEPWVRDPKTRTIYATFDLTGRALGAWNVEVEGPAGTESAPDAFTIAVPIAYRQPIRVDWIGRSVIRRGGSAEWSLAIMNPNDTDERGAVQLEMPVGLDWELNVPVAGDGPPRRLAGPRDLPAKLVVRDVLAPPGITMTAITVRLHFPSDGLSGSGQLRARWYTP